MLFEAIENMAAPLKKIPGLVSRGFLLLQPKNPPAQGVVYDADQNDEEEYEDTPHQRRKALVTRQEEKNQDALLQTSSWIDLVKTWVGGVIGVIGSPTLAIILGYGNGYLFNGFKDIDFTAPFSVVVFLGGYLMEFIGVALLYRASQAIQNKERQIFLITILFGLLLMSVSWLSQYTLLENEFANSVITFPDAALETMPVIGGVITGFGLHGHDAMFIVRAAIFHLGELACVFLIPVKKMDVSKTVALNMERTMARVQMNSASAMQGIMEQTFGLANQMMQDITLNASSNAQRTLSQGQQHPVEIQEVHTAVAHTQATPQPLQTHSTIHVVREEIAPVYPLKKNAPLEVVDIPIPEQVAVPESAVPESEEQLPDQGEAPAPQPFTQSSPDGKLAVIAQWGWDNYATGVLHLTTKPEREAAVFYAQTYGEIPPSFTPEQIDKWR